MLVSQPAPVSNMIARRSQRPGDRIRPTAYLACLLHAGPFRGPQSKPFDATVFCSCEVLPNGSTRSSLNRVSGQMRGSGGVVSPATSYACAGMSDTDMHVRGFYWLLCMAHLLALQPCPCCMHTVALHALIE